MIQPPRRNLPPDAEPWGRWVEGLLLAQNQSADANSQSINNTLRGVNASLQQLGNQVQTLTAQQATLTAQQADILDLIDKQVEFADGFANVDSFTTSTTATTLASFTLNIPPGFTRAIVQAASMIFVYNGTATFSYLHNRICVDEPDATTSCSRNMVVRLPNGQSASFAMIDSFGFAGLTGGALTIRQVVSTESVAISHATNGATVSAVATFLR